jgi:hypothetical protein
MAKDYWVSQTPGGDWRVKREGAERASSVHGTQAEAWDRARGLAREAHSEAFLKNRKNVIRERNTFGHDPRRSKG